MTVASTSFFAVIYVAITCIPHHVQAYPQFGATPLNFAQIPSVLVQRRTPYYAAIPHATANLNLQQGPPFFRPVKSPPIVQASLTCKKCNCCLLTRKGPFGPITQDGKSDCCQCGSCDSRIGNSYSALNRSVYPSNTPAILPFVSPLSPLLPSVRKPPMNQPGYPAPASPLAPSLSPIIGDIHVYSTPSPYLPFIPSYTYQLKGSGYSKPSLYEILPPSTSYYSGPPLPFHLKSFPYADKYALSPTGDVPISAEKSEAYLTPPLLKPFSSFPCVTSAPPLPVDQQLNNCDDVKWSKCCHMCCM